jgi:hypothetical protein
MSGTMSAAVRFEDHFGPMEPRGAGAPEHTARLRDLTQQMRHYVVSAISATDVAVKVELWASYRSARAEALALVESAARAPGARRLHSI